MEEKSIPYFVHEGDMARLERSNKRLFFIILLLIFVLVSTNVGWIVYESQFAVVEETKIEAEQETEDDSNVIIGGDFNVETKGKDH